MRWDSVTGWIRQDDRSFWGTVKIGSQGKIQAIARAEGGADPEGPEIWAGEFNAHSHPEQSIYVEMVDKSWDLATWCRHSIYKYSRAMTPYQVRLACRRAFGRMIGYGITSVMVSFYLHNRSGNLYDQEVIAAARDVGIRLIFGRMNYDIITEGAYQAKQDSQRSYYETPQEAERFCRDLMAQEGPTVMVCPSLHSIHASTAEAIASGIRLGCELGRPVQLHLSEDRGDVELALKDYGCRPVEFLKGLLDRGEVPSLSGLMVSDCCWINEREREIMAESSMKVVLNPRMNHRVKAGFPDLPGLLDWSIVPWLGTDGEASNDDLSVQGEREFLKERYAGVLAPEVIESLGRAPFPFYDGSLGVLEEGAWADLRILRKGRLETVLVGGEAVFHKGRLVGLDVERDIEGPLRAEQAALTAMV